MGLDAERYNRQLHPAVKPFISELAKKQTRFSEQELQQAARVVLANDRIGDGSRTSYASEAEAKTAGVNKVALAPDGKYYEVVAASPEAVQYVTAQLRTGPAEIQNEFMAAQFDRIKFDAKPWYTEAQNAGLDMLITSPAMGSNAPPATVAAAGATPRKAGSGVTNGESFSNKVKNGTIETNVVIEPKIGKQISSRGWTVDSIVETISKPSETVATKDTRFDPTTGSRKNDPATAYINADGSYVVVNNKDQTVVQVSDRTDPNWKAPWSTKND